MVFGWCCRWSGSWQAARLLLDWRVGGTGCQPEWLGVCMGSGWYGRLLGRARLVRIGRYVSLLALLVNIVSVTGVSAQTGSIGGAIGTAQGSVTVVHSDGQAEAARSGMSVAAGDRIETGL